MDRVECAASGHSPKQALRLGLRGSTLCWTAKVDGRAEAMFGLVVTSALGGTGTPWLLGTDEVYCHGREMLRWGPVFLARMVELAPSLSNVVAADNTRAIRFLRRLGFEVDDGAGEMLPFRLP